MFIIIPRVFRVQKFFRVRAARLKVVLKSSDKFLTTALRISNPCVVFSLGFSELLFFVFSISDVFG